MKPFWRIQVAFSLLILAGCAVSKPAAPVNDNSQFVTNGPAWAALWQQRSAEYKALCFQAYNLAQLRLDAFLQQQNSKPVAVITDIDETILDNSPNTVHQSLQGALYSDADWMVWTAQAAADTVPGAPTFFKYAASRGVEVFYVSNRKTAEKDVTLANLKKYNFPFADEAHLLLKTTSSGKDERRNLVAAKYTVLLYIGDNLGDFSGIFDRKSFEQRNQLAEAHAADFGNRFIVLPNAMYGEWLNALIDYKFNQTKEQQSAVLLKQLKNY